MFFKSKQELYDYLNKFNWNEKKETKLSSVYFLVKHENVIEPIYFTHFQDVWFHSPCCLMKHPLNDNELMEYVKSLYYKESCAEAYKFEKLMQKDGWHYSIENFQCEPFLPDEVEILQVFSETECLEWLINKESENEQR